MTLPVGELNVENPALRQVEFDEKMKAAVENYEEVVGPDPEVERLAAETGIVIPETTPAEPEFIVHHVKMDDLQPGAAPMGSQGRVQPLEEPNPDFVSQEMRNAAIAQAQAVREAQQVQAAAPAYNGMQYATQPQVIPQPFAPQVVLPQLPIAQPQSEVQYALRIQNLLKSEFTVVDCRFVNGQAHITLE